MYWFYLCILFACINFRYMKFVGHNTKDFSPPHVCNFQSTKITLHKNFEARVVSITKQNCTCLVYSEFSLEPKSKCKFRTLATILFQALRHEDVWGSGCRDPHFLVLGTSWRWVVSFTPLPLYPREGAPGAHFIGGWVDPRAGLDDMEKWNSFYATGTRTSASPGRPARS
jgi:hypothetical protein